MSDSDNDAVGMTAVVHGRVQGVGFRFSARSTARKLNLTGWVRNEPDGTVRVTCEGSRENVQRFKQWLHQGPPGAHVSKVDAREEPYRGQYRTFSVEA
jgi:acylphosphatase